MQIVAGRPTIEGNIMLERLTDRARKVMELASEEARRLNHEYLGTEHVLIGMIEEGTGVGVNVLKNLSVDLRTVRTEIGKLIKPGPEPVAAGKLPQTPRLKKMIEYTAQQAHRLHHNYLGTEHLLLGLLHEGDAVAAQALKNLGLNLKQVREEVLALLGVGTAKGAAGDQASPEAPPDSSQAVEYVDRLLEDAVRARATDLHFDPFDEGGGQVRMRIDGVLHPVDGPAEDLFPKVVDRIKAMAAMNVTERRLPQDGRCMLDVGASRVNLLVSAVPVHSGQRVVIRMLSQDTQDILLGLSKLGFTDRDLESVRGLCHVPSGMVIANGPAGSGKTTLLYSMLMEISTPEICIMTVEDPVEISFAGIGQIQIRPQIGLTIAGAIRHTLRQDSDAIMVGEIRDLEIANLCTQCALTGHLVLTTLHANSSPGAIKRLLDMGLPPFLVSSSVVAVISTRLVRTLCPECKQPSDPPMHSMPPAAVKFISELPDTKFCGPKGCDHCRGTGYRGRTGIFEILVMNDRLRQLVTDCADIGALRSAACEEGMKTMLLDGLTKAAQGLTTVEEIIRVTPMNPLT